MHCMQIIVYHQKFKNNWVHVKQSLKDCDHIVKMFKEYHGCPMDWELEMTKSVREAKWFNYYDVKSVNK